MEKIGDMSDFAEIKEILSAFRDYLLSSELKDKIVKIYLFGSYAKGEATAFSDIDILIVTTDGSHIERSLLNKSYDFLITKGVPLEIVILSIDELFPVRDYFLYNVLRYGMEVYSMAKDDIKMEILEDLKRLAEEYHDSAQEALERGRIRLAIDAGYNAAELAAKGLILLKEDDLPGSHGGIINVFSQLYVVPGEITKEIGRSLHACLKIRNDARYKPNAVLTKDNAKEVIHLAKSLIEIISSKSKPK